MQTCESVCDVRCECDEDGRKEDTRYHIDRAVADCHSLLTETALVANSTKFLLHTKTFLVSRRFSHFLNGRKHFETPHNLVTTELTSSNAGTWSYSLVLAGGGDVAEARGGALQET